MRRVFGGGAASVEREELGDGLGDFRARDDAIDKAVLKQEFRALEAVGEALVRCLLYDAPGLRRR